ncbi:MAG: RNA methyltransferase [Leptolyngbya sp.]|nr:RNA methyltransferase [Candidatus Melainabacteria bacterium]
MRNSHLRNISFIVVRPVFLGNIGSVARAMKNFGIEDLRLVSPPKNYKDAEARKMAVSAFNILKQAQVFDCLEDALKDVAVAVGTTCGKQRREPPTPISDLSAQLKQDALNNRVAFVLGDETDGLRQSDLLRCHHIVTIPTSDELSSLNLAQAAGILGYEMSEGVFNRLSEKKEAANSSEPLSTGDSDDEMLLTLGKISDSVNFSRTYNRENVLSEFRRLWQRAKPTKRESDLLKGLLIRINQHVGSNNAADDKNSEENE